MIARLFQALSLLFVLASLAWIAWIFGLLIYQAVIR